MCALIWKYDEQYECFKRAYENVFDPPDSLLLLLAGCASAPGTPPISNFDAENYVRKAIQRNVTYEAALMMRTIYRDKGDQQQEKYWDALCHELKVKGIHAEQLIPEVFIDRI